MLSPQPFEKGTGRKQTQRAVVWVQYPQAWDKDKPRQLGLVEIDANTDWQLMMNLKLV